ISDPQIFGTAKKIPLKPRKTAVPRLRKLIPSFHLFGYHAALLRGIKSCQDRTLLQWNPGTIDFDEAGVGNKVCTLVARNEIVQGDRVSCLFQPLTRLYDVFIRRNIFL